MDEIGNTFQSINNSLLEIKSSKESKPWNNSYNCNVLKSGKCNGNKSDYVKYIKLIKRNINYDVLCKTSFEYTTEKLDEIVRIMAETCAFRNEPCRINGNYIPAEVVKSVFLKLSYEHIEYVQSCIDKYNGKIRNIKSYLISALYNSQYTIDNYYSVIGNCVG